MILDGNKMESLEATVGANVRYSRTFSSGAHLTHPITAFSISIVRRGVLYPGHSFV